VLELQNDDSRNSLHQLDARLIELLTLSTRPWTPAAHRMLRKRALSAAPPPGAR